MSPAGAGTASVGFTGVAFGGRERALHGDIRLNGQEVDVVVGGGLQGFDEELTVDGSPIIRLTILDPDCRLERSGLLDLDRDDEDQLGDEVELIVDGVAYWLRQANRNATSDTVELVFEDREVCRMRETFGAVKVTKDALNTRGFLSRLCSTAGTPELIYNDPTDRETDAIAGARFGSTLSQNVEQGKRDRRRKPGVGEGVAVTVKHITATPEQKRNMNAALSEAVRHSPSADVLVALVAMITQESNWQNTQGGGDDSISYGLVQNIPGRSAGVNGTFTQAQALDIAYSVKSALLPPGATSAGGMIKYAKEHSGISAGDLADATINGLGVGDPDYVSSVNGWVPEARAIVAAFTGGDLPLSSGTQFTLTTRSPAALTVERDESYWDAARRTASERNARFFVVANQPYFLFDDALMRSRPRLTIADPRHPDADPDRTDGIVGIGWEWAPRRQLRKTDLIVNATIQQITPGTVVILDETCGPAGSDEEHPNRGRWLVGSYQRSRFSHQATVTLIKGRRPIAPADTTTRTSSVGGSSRDSKGVPSSVKLDGVPAVVRRGLAEAYRIHFKNYAYSWGGGHEHAGTASLHQAHSYGGPVVLGFDCSGYTGAQVAAAGLAYVDSSVPGSGDMASSLGEAGEGRWMTIWANSTHVWVEYKLPGGTLQANTAGGPPDGPHVRPGAASKAGFTPRHFPGT